MTSEPTSEPMPDLPPDRLPMADDLPSDPAAPSFGAQAADEIATGDATAPLGALHSTPDPSAFAPPPPLDAADSGLPLSPADAGRDNARRGNARRGHWAMSEWYDGWVFLGADGRPVVRNDGSRVGFRFADAARLTQELAFTPDEETADGSDRRALAPLDSRFNKDWDPQRPKSTLADMTKWTRLLAYQLVQTTEPEEAVRRAVSMIFGNPVMMDDRGEKLWVPTQYEAETVKALAGTLLRRVVGQDAEVGGIPDIAPMGITPRPDIAPFGAYMRGGLRLGANGRPGGRKKGEPPDSEIANSQSQIDDDRILLEIGPGDDGASIQRVANIWPAFQGRGMFYANPGPKKSEAIGGYNPRADHDLHFHLRLNDGREIRYLADTFEVHPYDKDKDTREHDKIIKRLSPEERAHITKATREMVETGELSPESKAKARGQFSMEARRAAKRLPPE